MEGRSIEQLILALGYGDIHSVISALNNCPKDPNLSCIIKVEGRNCRQIPVLNLALPTDDINKVKILLDDGLNPNFVGDSVFPPLMVAVQIKQRNVVKLLLQAGADVNAQCLYGITIMHVLASHNDLESIKLVHRYGAYLDCKGYYQMTPLHYAASKGAHPVVEWLVAHGVDIKSVCIGSETAFSLAMRNGYFHLAQWIQMHWHNTEVTSHLQATSTYKKIHVFNYIKFHNAIYNRNGAKVDSHNIRNTFSNLGYQVKIYEDFTFYHTKQQLDVIRRDTCVNSLVIIVLSHGDGVSRDHFITSDKYRYSVLDVQRTFTDRKCPSLKGCPKVIMGIFCRGDASELQSDNITVAYGVPRHMATIYAAHEDIEAKRHPERGTVFISSLCSVIKKYPNKKLVKVFDRLAVEMTRQGGTTPQMTFSPPSIADFTF